MKNFQKNSKKFASSKKNEKSGTFPHRNKYFVQHFLIFLRQKTHSIRLADARPRSMQIAYPEWLLLLESAFKINNRHPPEALGSRDKFVSLRPYSAATETFRPPHHTLFPRRLHKHLLLPKGCQNRYLRASNSLYSRRYS